MTKARKIAMLVFTVLLFFVLISLAVWQLQRLEWKNNLIAHSESAVSAKPVTYTDIEAGLENGYDINFLRVQLTGVFRHDLERYVYRSNGKKPGFRVVTPFLEEAGYIVMVDRGWVDEKHRAASTRKNARKPEGKIVVTGVTRNHDPGLRWFLPPADKTKNIWYWYDRADIAASYPAGLGKMQNGSQAVIGSIFVQLEPKGEPGNEPWPQVGPVKLNLPNHHLQYAITWFALALVFLVMGVYFFYGLRKQNPK